MFLDKAIFYCLTWAVFWLPFVAVPAGVFCKTFTDIGLELALLLWLFKIITKRTSGFRTLGGTLDKALLFVALASLISIPFSFIKVWAIGDFISILLGIFAVYLIASVTRTKEQVYTLCTAIISSAVIVAFIGFFQIPLRHSVSLAANPLMQPLLFLKASDHPSRVCSTFIEYSGVNVYAGYLAAVLMLLLVPLILNIKKLNWRSLLGNVLAAAILLASLVLTKGRAAYIALFLSFCCVFWQVRALRRPLMTGLVAVSIAAFILVPPVQYAILDIFDRTSSSNQERAVLYGPAFRQILQRPLTGFGDGHSGRKIVFNKAAGAWEESHDKTYFSFTSIQSVYDKAEYYRKKGIVQIQRPHNIYLTTMIDMGIFGLAALIYLFYALISSLLAIYRKKANTHEGLLALAFAGVFFSYAAYGLLHDSLNARPYAMLFWILIGMTGATLNNMSSVKSGKRRVASGKRKQKKR